MGILISKNNFDNSILVGEFFINKSKLVKYKEHYYCLIGEIFSHEITDVIEIVLSNDEELFKSIIGDFSLIILKHDKICILNDRAGRHLVFYSLKNGISISDDLWSLVKHDGYTTNDVDILSFKTQVFFFSNPDYRTFLKDLYILPNAIIADYTNDKLIIKKYWQFKLQKNSLSTSEKYDILDQTLNEAFISIKKHNQKETVFGVGISGGMDSRIIPYYALKNGLKLKSFIIGQEKPQKFWKSNDHISSEKIVEHFKLDHKKFEFNELSYHEKMLIDVDNAPLCSSQIFKIPNIEKVDFDVLLTGASGFYVGSSPFYNKIRELSLEEMVFVQQSDLNLKRKYYRVKKGINYLFGKVFDVTPTVINSLEGVISQEEVELIRKNVLKFFSHIDELSKTEKLMNYAISVLGQRNKAGSFESLVNNKKDYTPYFPFLIDAVQSWTEEDLYDRKLFEGFIRERLPELARIKGQDHKTSLSNKNPNKIQKLFSLIRFVIRGTGVMNYPRWAKSKAFKQYVNQQLEYYDYVSKYFDLNKIKKLTYNGRLDSSVLTGILKLNECIHKIDKINS